MFSSSLEILHELYVYYGLIVGFNFIERLASLVRR